MTVKKITVIFRKIRICFFSVWHFLAFIYLIIYYYYYFYYFAFIFILNVWATVFHNTYHRFIENLIRNCFRNCCKIKKINACKSEPSRYLIISHMMIKSKVKVKKHHHVIFIINIFECNKQVAL